MRILLTGGTGFIGRNIIEQLSGSYEILAPDRKELELMNTDAVYRFLEEHPVDIVIHAANLGGNRKEQHFSGISNINLRIFFNLVQARHFFGRMITFGSGAEYDKKYSIIKAKETDFGKRVPSDEYGFYKYVCAQYIGQVDFITHLRLFAVFGKYEDHETRFISSTICKALLGLPVTIYENVVFDYLYVDDFIKILDIFLRKKPACRVLNVGRGVGIDLKTIASKVLNESNINVPVNVLRSGTGKEYTCDTSVLNKEAGDIIFDPIESSISKMLLYYESIIGELSKDFF